MNNMNKKLYFNNAVINIFKNTHKIANTINSNYIGTNHILLGILKTKNCFANTLLKIYGLFDKDIDILSNNYKYKPKFIYKNSKYTKKAIELIFLAEELRKKFNNDEINSDILLLSMLLQENTFAIKILKDVHIDIKNLTKILVYEIYIKNANKETYIFNNVNEKIISQAFEMNIQDMDHIMKPIHNLVKKIEDIEKIETEQKKITNQTPYLDKFTTDLTALAAEGKIIPVIGREKEIERVINILNRKTKNNPVLIGEPGVGKTSIVEGLALMITNKQVPNSLSHKRILSLNLPTLIAGTMYRGDFEKRILEVINEAKIIENGIILFIDEMHMLVGAGDMHGSMDAANILKPALARGEIQIIGATTTDEYRKHIEKDPAFERRLQSIMVREPNDEETYHIIKGIKSSFENYHKVNIDDNLIYDIIYLSKRYITDRYLPDKAIDLIDEACAIKSTNKKHINQSISIQELKTKLIEIRKETDLAVANYEYEKASNLRKQELELIEKIKKIQNLHFSSYDTKEKKYEQSLTKEDILKVISNISNVPVENLSKNDIDKLKNLEQQLKSEIKGQDEIIDKIAQSIRRVKAGLEKPNRPLGSFLFLGPSGVGKTMLVKKLAKYLFDNEENLIRLDMSEYTEQNSVSKLIGASAGYIGYEEGGWLVNQVRKKPYSIVLIDEIEKAHKDLFNIFLQILDEGHLTDSHGKKANFKNTIIIMTSNIGTQNLTQKAAVVGFAHTENEEKKAEIEYNRSKENVLEELKKRMPTEFLNRIDNIIIFKPLKQKDVEEITKIQINQLIEKLKNMGYQLKVSNKVIKKLASIGFSPEYGARNISRVIQDYIENKIADILLYNPQQKTIIINNI